MLRTLLAARAAVVFSGICNDKRVDCSNWARDGECTGDNSRYMMEICPLSCGVCTPSATTPTRRAARGRRRASARPTRVDAAHLPDELRAVHAGVQGHERRLPGLGRQRRVQREPRVHDPHVPGDVRGVQVDVQGPAARLPGLDLDGE